MKLLKRLGTKHTRYSIGLFLCPYCENEVERRLVNGSRDKSCGCYRNKHKRTVTDEARKNKRES